ncbi:MAG: TIGR02266 family protein [Myxococcaceae bacterium]
MRDNRKSERVHSRLRCWCEGENVTVYARIGNLSEGGLFLRTSTPLEQGSKAVVRFGLADTSEVEASAIVVWARNDGDSGPPGMGLMFQEVDPQKLSLIREIVTGERQVKKAGS